MNRKNNPLESQNFSAFAVVESVTHNLNSSKKTWAHIYKWMDFYQHPWISMKLWISHKHINTMLSCRSRSNNRTWETSLIGDSPTSRNTHRSRRKKKCCSTPSTTSRCWASWRRGKSSIQYCHWLWKWLTSDWSMGGWTNLWRKRKKIKSTRKRRKSSTIIWQSKKR